MTVCVWYGGRLCLDAKRGWVHADDGQVYKDDGHCALPEWAGMPVGDSLCAGRQPGESGGEKQLLIAP